MKAYSKKQVQCSLDMVKHLRVLVWKQDSKWIVSGSNSYLVFSSYPTSSLRTHSMNWLIQQKQKHNPYTLMRIGSIYKHYILFLPIFLPIDAPKSHVQVL